MDKISPDSELLLWLYLEGQKTIALSGASRGNASRSYARLLDEGLADTKQHGSRLTVGLTEIGRRVVEEALDAARRAGPVH